MVRRETLVTGSQKAVQKREGGLFPFPDGDGKRLVEKIKNQYPSWDARILRATYDGVQSEVC